MVFPAYMKIEVALLEAFTAASPLQAGFKGMYTVYFGAFELLIVASLP